MAFRVSIRKVQQVARKTSGWSENFWNSSTDLTGLKPITTALADALFYATGNECYVPSARISDVTSFRRVAFLDFGRTGSNPAVTGLDADYPNSALLLQLTGAGDYKTLQWIRGIPDAVVTKGGRYTPTALAGFTANINRIMAELTGGTNGWSIRALLRTQARKPVRAVNTLTGIATIPGHSFAFTDGQAFVRLSGYRVPRGLNRVWRVAFVDADTVQLLDYIPPTTAVVAFGTSPKARQQVYTYVPIQTAEIVRATSHYTGRPTELLGGRRRNRQLIRAGQPVAV